MRPRHHLLLLSSCFVVGCAACPAARGGFDVDDQGRLSRFQSGPHASLLLQPVTVRVVDSLTDQELMLSSVPAESSRQGETAVHRRRLPGLELDVVERLEVDGQLKWTLDLHNRTDRRRQIMIEFVFEIDGRDALPFFTAYTPHPPWPERGTLAYGYFKWDEGVRWGMPLASVYSPKRDVGISFCAELSGHVRPISCLMRRDGDKVRVWIRRRYIRIEPNASEASVLYLASHAGDWRSALAWVRDRWADQFYVKYPDVERIQFLGMGGAAPANVVDHHLPYALDLQYGKWYGEDIPDDEQWHMRVQRLWQGMREDELPGVPPEDAGHEEILRWILDQEIPRKYWTTHSPQAVGNIADDEPYLVNRKLINDYLDYLHERGFIAHWYFCPMEAWGPYMKKMWPDGFAFGPYSSFPPRFPDEDKLTPMYYSWGSYVTNPDPDTPFGRHLIKQVQNLLEFYPALDGLYIDQPHHVEIDFARDDGLSIIDGKPVSNTGYTFDRFMERVQEMVHAKGKYIWCNIPSHIHNARWMDVMQAESRHTFFMDQMKYFGIGNRITLTLFPFSPQTQVDGTTQPEYFDHVALAAGFIERLQPSRSGHERTLARLADGATDAMFGYRYVGSMLRGRSWVLQPHCLVLPEGMTGNVFRTGAGNFLVPVIRNGSSTSTVPLHYDVPVTVRIREAESIRAVYLVSVDHAGPKKLDFDRDGGVISVSIPRQRSASMLLLAATGRFAALDRVAIRRGMDELTLVLENWTTSPWHFRAQANGFASGTIDQQIPAGASVSVGLACDWTGQPTAEPGLRYFGLETNEPTDIPEVRLPGDDEVEPYQLFVDEPLLVDFDPPDSIPLNQRAELSVIVGNNTPEQLTIDLAGQMSGAVIDPMTPVTLAAGTRTRTQLFLTPARAGAFDLSISARSGDSQATATRGLAVVRTALGDGDLGRIASASVVFDSYAQDTGGDEPWTLLVNGVEAAEIPPDRATHWGVWRSQRQNGSGRFDLAPDAVKALERVNEIRIRNPNRGGDPVPYGFKVRDLELHLVLADGSRLILPAGGSILSSNPDWLHAEGERFDLDEDLVWQIVVPGEREQ